MYAHLSNSSPFTKASRANLESVSSRLKDEFPRAFSDFLEDSISWSTAVEVIDYLDLDGVLLENRRLIDRRVLTVSECVRLHSNYSKIFSLDFSELSQDQLYSVLLPITDGVAIPFSTALHCELLKRIDWTAVPEFWSIKAEHNSPLLELRKGAAEEVEESGGRVYSSLKSSYNIPFLDGEEDSDTVLEKFLENYLGKKLALDELDFLISTAYWLLGGIWSWSPKANALFSSILLENSESLSSFKDEAYRYAIWRVYSNHG